MSDPYLQFLKSLCNSDQHYLCKPRIAIDFKRLSLSFRRLCRVMPERRKRNYMKRLCPSRSTLEIIIIRVTSSSLSSLITWGSAKRTFYLRWLNQIKIVLCWGVIFVWYWSSHSISFYVIIIVTFLSCSKMYYFVSANIYNYHLVHLAIF